MLDGATHVSATHISTPDKPEMTFILDQPGPHAGEDRFKRFAEHSSDAIWFADVATGKIDYFSPAARRLWTETLRIETLADWQMTVHPDDRGPTLARRELVRQGLCQRFQYRIIDGNGVTLRQVRETSFPIPAPDGAVEHVGGIVEDISPEIQIYLVQRSDVCDPVLSRELQRSDHRIKHFSSADGLMQMAEVLNPGCVILDLRGASDNYPRFPELFLRKPADLQVIVIGSSQTPSAQMFAAVRAGAIDFLIEPIDPAALHQAIQSACSALPTRPTDAHSERHRLADSVSRLPRREREVMMGLIGGGTNKSIARDLGISPRTVEIHRAHLMERLNIRTASELVHLAYRAGLNGLINNSL